MTIALDGSRVWVVVRMSRTLFILGAALCAAVTMSVFAGVRVEIDGDCRDDRTVQIAADEFRSFYARLTGREAKGERRLLLKVDRKMSADGYDAFSLKSDEAGAVVGGGNGRSVLYAVYELLEKRGAVAREHDRGGRKAEDHGDAGAEPGGKVELP